MRANNLINLFAVFLSLFACNSIAEQKPLVLTVQVEGANRDRGQVLVSLFSSSEHYLKVPQSKKSMPIDSEGAAKLVFNNLDAGRYAVSVIYDENSDGELNTGFLGIPKESVGFSNNVEARFGPPSFDKAAFELLTSTKMVIELKSVKH